MLEYWRSCLTTNVTPYQEINRTIFLAWFVCRSRIYHLATLFLWLVSFNRIARTFNFSVMLLWLWALFFAQCKHGFFSHLFLTDKAVDSSFGKNGILTFTLESFLTCCPSKLFVVWYDREYGYSKTDFTLTACGKLFSVMHISVLIILFTDTSQLFSIQRIIAFYSAMNGCFSLCQRFKRLRSRYFSLL